MILTDRDLQWVKLRLAMLEANFHPDKEGPEQDLNTDDLFQMEEMKANYIEKIKLYEGIKSGTSGLSTDNFRGIGNVLIAKRIQKGITQQGLAEMMIGAVKTKDVRYWEQNQWENAMFSTVLDVIDILDVKFDLHMTSHPWQYRHPLDGPGLEPVAENSSADEFSRGINFVFPTQLG